MDDWGSYVQRAATGKTVVFRWSCGNNKNIQVRSRVFLLRQGSDHPGIVGSGWVTQGSFQDEHWDPTKRRKGRKAWFVTVKFDSLLLPEECLSRHQLLKGILPATLLKVAASGVAVNPDLAAVLETRWAAHRASSHFSALVLPSAISGWEGDSVEYRSYRRKRDQKLKRAAFRAANGVCSVCDVDYSKILKGAGVRVLQVHHKQQLGQMDTPRLNSLDDLAVVCANCHALLHVNPKRALKVEALKSMLDSPI